MAKSPGLFVPVGEVAENQQSLIIKSNPCSFERRQTFGLDKIAAFSRAGPRSSRPNREIGVLPGPFDQVKDELA